MDLSTWLHVWQITFTVVAILDIALLGLFVLLGVIDEREERRLGLSPRQQQAAKHHNAWDRAGTGRRLPR